MRNEKRGITVRLSHIQKDVLFILIRAFDTNPAIKIPTTRLLKLINEGFDKFIADRNFRASCHTLRKNGLVRAYRNEKDILSWSLAEPGIEIARKIAVERLGDDA
jgi:hypothetical protein